MHAPHRSLTALLLAIASFEASCVQQQPLFARPIPQGCRAAAPRNGDALKLYAFDEPEWQIEQEFGVVEITGAFGYHSAPVALRLEGNDTGFFAGDAFLDPTTGTGLFPTIPGEPYTIRAWVNTDAADDHAFLRFSVSALVAGLPYAVADFDFHKADLPAGDWQPFTVGTFIDAVSPGPGPVSLIFSVSAFADFGFDNVKGRWLVDDIEFTSAEEQEDMSKRRPIREAIVTRVKTVTTANGYSLTLDPAAVVKGPSNLDKISSFPHISITHGDFVTVPMTLGGRSKTTMTTRIGIACKRSDVADADDQCDDVYGELANALCVGPRDPDANGTHKAPWLGLSYITDVNVVEGDSLDLTPEVARDLAVLVLSVEVAYEHARRQP